MLRLTVLNITKKIRSEVRLECPDYKQGGTRCRSIGDTVVNLIRKNKAFLWRLPVLITVLSFYLLGCSTVPVANDNSFSQQLSSEANGQAAICMFSNGRTPAPAWMCGQPLADYSITQLGYSISGDEAEAIADARDRLTPRLQATIETAIEKNDRRVGQFSGVDSHGIATLLASESRVKLRVVAQAIDPNTGALYVVVAADARQVLNIVRNYSSRK